MKHTTARKLITLILCGFFLTGCGTFFSTADKAAKKIGTGIRYYCDSTDRDVRLLFRERVNYYAAPNEITVTCARDGKVLRSRS